MISNVLAKISFDSHAKRLLDMITERKIECFVTTTMSDIRWATGFTGSYGALIVTAESVQLITDGRYIIEASRSVRAGEVTTFVLPTSLNEVMVRRLREKGVGSVAIDESMSIGMLKTLQGEMRGIEFTPISSLIDELRLVKDEAEIEVVRIMCGLADKCFNIVLKYVRVGETEQGIAKRITDWIVERGANNSFSPIVASGENTAMPHAKPTSRAFELGDLIMLDFGVSIGGYGSDLTRTFVLGSRCEQWQVELWEGVLEAQEAAIKAVAPGVSAAEVDGVARGILSQRGLGDAFVHTLGHCLGGGSGRLSPTSSVRLEAGHLWTIEPGAYLRAKGGVRIEDDVEVTASGGVVMTGAPKFLTLEE